VAKWAGTNAQEETPTAGHPLEGDPPPSYGQGA
jgi:hypothetical protein